VIQLVTKYPAYKIINYDKLDYCSSLKNLESIADEPNYEFVHGDVLAVDLVNYVIRKEGVDTIMHFAAQTHVGEAGAHGPMPATQRMDPTVAALDAPARDPRPRPQTTRSATR